MTILDACPKLPMTVADVREFAMKNYNEGGDSIVECWTDKDIEEFILAHHTDSTKRFEQRLLMQFHLYDSVCNDIINA